MRHLLRGLLRHGYKLHDPQQQFGSTQLLQGLSSQLLNLQHVLWSQQQLTALQLPQTCDWQQQRTHPQGEHQQQQQSHHNGCCWQQHATAAVSHLHQYGMLQHRGYAAAPARAIADTMALVAQRKLAEVQRQYDDLQAKMEGLSPGSDTYQKLIKEAAALGPLVEGYQQLQAMQHNIEGLHDVMSNEQDKEMQELARDELVVVQAQVEELQKSLLLSLLPHDSSDEGNVVLEIRSSVGGEWAGDFAADLLEMYRLFAAEHGWRFEVLESKPTDLGGIKSATAVVSGSGVYGMLRWESGVHRATMVPGNDKFGRMQTGTAVVVAMPEASEVQVQVNESDLRIETYRASGKGGQHVNTTDSAVRIVHLPTGIVVTCQNERSQLQNKAQALKVLRAKLYDAEIQKQAASMSAERKAAAGLANTNERIRSYYYNDGRVTDHRIGLTMQVDVERFMSDGQRLAEVIQALQLHQQQEQLQQLLEPDS